MPRRRRPPTAESFSNTTTLWPIRAELLGHGQSRGARADHGHTLAAGAGRALGADPAGGEGAIDDLLLDLADLHRVVAEALLALVLARGGAQQRGKLREIISTVQSRAGVLPAAAIGQVDPRWNRAFQRAAGLLAQRVEALHAAGRGQGGDFLPHPELVQGLIALCPRSAARCSWY